MQDLDIILELENRKMENRLFQYEPYEWQREFHNNLASEKMLIAGNQLGKCTSYNTRVSTPLGDKMMGELEYGDSVLSFDGEKVVTGRVIETIRKPAEKIYRFYTNNGKWFEVPYGHRVFVQGEWIFSQDLLDKIKHLELTNLAHVQLGLLSGALRLMRRHEDFLLDYQEYLRLCGQQLRGVADTDPTPAPLLNDVLRHNELSSYSGAQGCRYNDTLLLSSGLLSNLDAFHHGEGLKIVSEYYKSYNGDKRYLLTLPAVLQLYAVEVSRLLSSGEERLDRHQVFSLDYPSNKCLSDSIIGYEYIGEQELFDISVEKYENYIAGGVINHNTYSASREVSFHATGLYPEWWEGRRFHKPELIWAASKTNEDCRDIAQVELLGGMENRKCLGTGAIPKSCIGKPKIRQAGIGDVVDYVDIVWHDEDGNPTDHRVKLQFKSYEQGWQKFQGRKVDVVWLDEEPENFKIYSECVMRTINTKGIVLVTFTPLSGWTELVERFHSGEHENFVLNATWDDAPHLSEELKAEYLKKFPAHERDARSKGIPMLGEGRVFSTPEEDIVVPPMPVPDHWAKIIGIDFGIGDGGDPCATILLAYDRDTDTVYLVKSDKRKIRKIISHAEVIRGMGGGLDTDNIPVSWPHDGLKSSGDANGNASQIIRNYKKHRLSLLGKSARINNDKGGSQSVWQSVEEMIDRMETGRFKIFSTNQEFIKEYRNYHQKNGKLVKYNEHLIAATRYALMMLRYARVKKQGVIRRTFSQPILSSNI